MDGAAPPAEGDKLRRRVYSKVLVGLWGPILVQALYPVAGSDASGLYWIRRNMKAKRRHELKENDLAHALWVARDYVGENGRMIGLVAVVMVGVVAAAAWAATSRSRRSVEAWIQRDELVQVDSESARASVDQLRDLIDSSSDEEFVLRGLIQLAGMSLELSARATPAPDPQLNQIAQDAYQQLYERFKGNPAAMGVALLGLATVEENSFVLDEDPAHKENARKHLTEIINSEELNNWPNQRQATDRLNRLDHVFTVVKFAPALEPVVDPAVGISPTGTLPSDGAGSVGPPAAAPPGTIPPPATIPPPVVPPPDIPPPDRR